MENSGEEEEQDAASPHHHGGEINCEQREPVFPAALMASEALFTLPRGWAFVTDPLVVFVTQVLPDACSGDKNLRGDSRGGTHWRSQGRGLLRSCRPLLACRLTLKNLDCPELGSFTYSCQTGMPQFFIQNTWLP